MKSMIDDRSPSSSTIHIVLLGSSQVDDITHLLRLSRGDGWRRRGPEAVASECELREGMQHFRATFQVAERIGEKMLILLVLYLIKFGDDI